MRLIDCVPRKGTSKEYIMVHFCPSRFFRNITKECHTVRSGWTGVEMCRRCWREEKKWYHFKKGWWW